ncbi:MAG: hypothetical protein KKB51_22695 [Candidatus Riflebacteria bacterium]|nr:hypothetical protein [Candidatus Riflebacteria bacterium]
MNKNENNNKRIIAGAAIFAVLIGLNLLVRYSRSSRSNPPTPAALTTAIPYPASIPTTLPTTATATAQSLPDTESLIPGSEQQMLALTGKLEALKQELQSIENPFEQPDLRVNLQLANYDRFRWKIPVIVSTETVLLPPEPEIATIAKALEILGSFRVRGRNKLLIRENQKVFLVNEGEEAMPDSIIFERLATESYMVFDSGGATHDLKLKHPQDDGVEKAINILTGKRTQQPSFDMQTSEPATNSEHLLNTGGR